MKVHNGLVFLSCIDYSRLKRLQIDVHVCEQNFSWMKQTKLVHSRMNTLITFLRNGNIFVYFLFLLLL